MRQLGLPVLAATIVAVLGAGPVHATEVSLFDAHQAPVAYVGDDLTIYTWGGEPVGYLAPDTEGGFHIYAFGGTHLGWYVAGVIRDHQGHQVGARRGAFVSGTFAAGVLFEPYKPLKQLTPFKAAPASAPVRPPFVDQWSPTSLEQFFPHSPQ